METTVIFVEPVITLAYKDLVIDEGIDVNEVVVIEKTVLDNDWVIPLVNLDLVQLVEAD